MEARLWRFRVFTARDLYKGPKGALADHILKVDASTNIRVTVGSIPESYISANSNAGAILQLLLSGGVGDPETRSAPKDWLEPDQVYTCVCVSQDTRIVESPEFGARKYFWYDQDDAHAKLLDFQDRARSALDGVTGRLIALLGSEVLDSVLHESRTFIEAEDRPAQPIPRFSVGSLQVTHTRTLDDLNLARLNDLASTSAASIKGAEPIGRWFATSLRESEPFRRFMWAYAGLEVLSGKATSIWRGKILDLIANNAAISDSLARELIWPTNGDESREPWRNLTFRFSVMATIGSPETATDDLGKFKDLQSFRNRIHGQHIDERVVERKAVVAIELLRHYAPIVVGSL